MGVALAIAVLVPAAGGATKPRPLQRVTLISDSVAGSIAFDTGAKAILAQGVDLFLEPGQARRVGGTTPDGGIAPPTVIELVPALGRKLGPTVIVDTGYNDVSADYAANMETALGELHAAGVTRVLWVTLRTSSDHSGYQVMDDAIAAAAARHHELTVVDWNGYSSTHPEWLQPDGVHLTGAGPRALARFLHASLIQAGVAR